MDTIIYVYPLKEMNKGRQEILDKRGERNRRKDWREKGPEQKMGNLTEMYSVEELDMPDYHLVRVGISKELAQICGRSRQQNDDVKIQESFWRRYRRKKQQRMEQQREQELLADFLHQIWEEPEQSFFVCEEAFPFFNRWEFNGYFDASWVRHMLRYAGGEQQVFMSPHFLVLGQARCLPEILYPCVGKMKSLKWVLPARQFREELQELVEDVYDEYGLAMDVHLLEDEDSYRKTRISCAQPTVVLDFCEVDRVPTVDIAKGSVWLDMASTEGKRRRIEERNTGIHYFSLKKEWKQPQKALFHLDTISKNGYNT